MSGERDGYPAGVPCWVDTSQPDPDAAATFYGGLFGWEFEDRMPSDAPGRYLVATLRGLEVAAIGSQMEGDPPTPMWNTYVWVDSADETAAKVREAGGTVLAEPFDVGDAGRMAVCADPAGAVFCLWQAGTNRGAQLVNGAGAWVFNELNTPDPKGAEAFYGAVFGWEARSVDFGAGESWMLIRPGYGDHLEELDPGVRERHAEGGAPEGFTDCVAWMQQPTGDAPPHWSITFTVDDADASAARVTELGGTVLAGPFDAGPTKIAIVRDPQGAVFSVSKYDPD